MILKKWDSLPSNIRNEEVKPYYQCLSKKTISLIVKRCFDIIFSMALIVVLSPIMLILAIAIRLDSTGHVFYRQERITQYGRTFKILKFRTMVQNADKIGSSITVNDDMRITRVGSFIRNIRLDEIPQLFNILIGDMTFVGARPEVKKYVDHYTNEMMATLLLPAGLTCDASIAYKDEAKLLERTDNIDETYINTILPGKMKYNLDGIKRFSCLNDVYVLAKTIAAVFR